MKEVQDKLGLAAILADLPKTKQDILDAKDFIKNLLGRLDDAQYDRDYFEHKVNLAEEFINKVYEYRNNTDMIEVMYKKYLDIT